MSDIPEPKLRDAALMCLAAGFVDAHGFLNFDRVFTANMTGNTVLMAIALAGGAWAETARYLATVVVFLAGAFAAALLKRWLGKGFPALLAAAAFLAAVSAAAPHGHLALWALAFAMGLQGGSVTRFAGVHVQTVVLTSSLVRIAESLVGGAAAPPALPRGGTGYFVLVWVTYALGAAGDVLAAPFLPWPLALPALLLTVAGLDLWHQQRRA